MSTVEARRVREARERLRETAGSGWSRDPAVRIAAFDSPVPGERELQLHRRRTVLAGLSEPARQSIAETLDALVAGVTPTTLRGQIEIDGSRISFPPPGASWAPDVGRPVHSAPPIPPVASTEFPALEGLIEVFEASVSLTAAELRGATSLAHDLRTGGVWVGDIFGIAGPIRLFDRKSGQVLSRITQAPGSMVAVDQASADLVNRQAGHSDAQTRVVAGSQHRTAA